MKYKSIRDGIFISRPNRFVAYVDFDGEPVKCHVPNTGRCKELLISGTRVWCDWHDSPDRKTACTLVTVQKGGRLINIDSQAPNKLVRQWLITRPDLEGAVIRQEYTYGGSRLDYYVRAGNRQILMEVKGVTLEHQNTAYFPDAPTLRGVKHLEELAGALEKGYECEVIFVIQMGGIKRFMPNAETHPKFADKLEEVAGLGVKLKAFDCLVSGDEITAGNPVPVVLQ